MFGSTWTGGWDPKRGDGTYIAGRWYDLGVERTTTTSQRPVISHRYLLSLAKDRAQSKSKVAVTPVYWYKSSNASVVDFHLKLTRLFHSNLTHPIVA
jgi:hypothetical protein